MLQLNRFRVITFCAVLIVCGGLVYAAIVTENAPEEPSQEALTCLKTATGPVAQAGCFRNELSRRLQQKGLAAAFELFLDLYGTSPVFASNCHDATHILGVAAYDQFKEDAVPVTRRETSLCGYGFYHGFMEKMLSESGTSHYDDARAYCESLRTSSVFPSAAAGSLAADACYHGIGHALFDSIDIAKWGDPNTMVNSALTECRLVAKTDEQRWGRCASGVFNSLAIAMSAQKYGLSFPKSDPAKICRAQDPYIQKSCFTEMIIGFIAEKNFDDAQSFKFILSLKNKKDIETALYANADNITKHTVASIDLDAWREKCTSFSAYSYKSACLRGVLNALADTEVAETQDPKVLQFCSTFDTETPERQLCYDSALGKLRGSYSNDSLKNICSKLPKPDNNNCGSFN